MPQLWLQMTEIRQVQRLLENILHEDTVRVSSGAGGRTTFSRGAHRKILYAGKPPNMKGLNCVHSE